MAHLVAVVALPQLNAFELAVACEVFGLERPELGVEWYDFVLCTPGGGSVEANEGFTLSSPHGFDIVAERADTVIVPGVPMPHDRPHAGLVDALQAAWDRGARVVSFCSGVFALAAAGILDGRTATTHWLFANELDRLYPQVKVRPDVLYVDEGRVLTSAGTAAGIDLALHIVRNDHGAAVANGVARRMVVPPHRDGGQAQFVSPPVPEVDAYDHLGPTLDWMVTHLAEPLSVELMAAHALLSARTFARRFKEATGATPHEWLTARRLQHAQQLLESTDLAIDRVAAEAGLGSGANLRLHFDRSLGTSPSAYRRAFRVSA
jgi:AraC family transcriptional activator FtrA